MQLRFGYLLRVCRCQHHLPHVATGPALPASAASVATTSIAAASATSLATTSLAAAPAFAAAPAAALVAALAPALAAAAAPALAATFTSHPDRERGRQLLDRMWQFPRPVQPSLQLLRAARRLLQAECRLGALGVRPRLSRLQWLPLLHSHGRRSAAATTATAATAAVATASLTLALAAALAAAALAALAAALAAHPARE